jgi:hypothetical protein
MAGRGGAMHVARNRRTYAAKSGEERVYESVLLRRTYRDGVKVKHKTLANLGMFFRSQRRFPIMAAIRPVVLDDCRRLALSAPGVEDFVVDVVVDGPRNEVATTGWQGKGIDQGAEAQD